jgi:hypothetical protein
MFRHRNSGGDMGVSRFAAVVVAASVISGCNQVTSEERMCRESITSTALNPEKISFSGFHAITAADMRQRLMMRVETDKDRSPEKITAASQALDEAENSGSAYSELNVTALDRFSGGSFTRPYACGVERGQCQCFAE